MNVSIPKLEEQNAGEENLIAEPLILIPKEKEEKIIESNKEEQKTLVNSINKEGNEISNELRDQDRKFETYLNLNEPEKSEQECESKRENAVDKEETENDALNTNPCIKEDNITNINEVHQCEKHSALEKELDKEENEPQVEEMIAIEKKSDCNSLPDSCKHLSVNENKLKTELEEDKIDPSNEEDISELKVESIHEDDLTLLEVKDEPSPLLINIPTLVDIVDKVILHDNKEVLKYFMIQIQNKIKSVKLKETQRKFQVYQAFKKILNLLRLLSVENKSKQDLDIKCKQYQEYSNYKTKAKVFKMIKSHKEYLVKWIASIRNNKLNRIVWDCIDSWKVYINYKKAKSYFKEKKKREIFASMKSLMTNQKNIHRISNLLKFILCTRNCLHKLKRFSLNQSMKNTNKILAKEFRRNYLLRKLFKIFLDWHGKVKRIFLKPLKDSLYIKLSVAQKETVSLHKNKGVVIKKLTNNIKII